MFRVTDDVVYGSVQLRSLATRMFNKNICLCGNLMSFHVGFCVHLSFQFPLFFLCAKLVVLDELAYDGLSFRICAIKVF